MTVPQMTVEPTNVVCLCGTLMVRLVRNNIPWLVGCPTCGRQPIHLLADRPRAS